MNKTFWRSPKLILGTLTLVICLGSCAKDQSMPEHGASFDEVVGSMKSGTPLLEMSYTAETFSRVVKTSGVAGDFPKLDMAYMKPQSRRKDIQFTLMPNGSSSTVITKLTSKNPINIPTNVLENTSIPELNKIIATNEEIRLYDRNGNEIDVLAYGLPIHSDLVDNINELGANYSAAVVNNLLVNRQTQNHVQELDDYITNAQSNNYLVTDHGNDIWTVQEPLSNAGSIPTSMQSDYAVHIFNKAENLLLASAIYDEQDVMKSRMMLIYDFSAQYGAQIQKIRQETQETLPSGELAYSEVITEIENLVITLNY